MFKGFNLLNFSPDEQFVEEYRAQGEAVGKRFKRAAQGALDAFVTSGGTIDGSALQQDWFPNLPADVFLSHSHRNVNVANALAGWILVELELTPFVDSTVWGFADELLRGIDNAYCLNAGGETYSYEKRNGSTSHVHMMLSTALGSMIDRTECLFFVNTPQSIHSRDAIDRTRSPWIYSELAMASVVRERRPGRHEELLRESKNFSAEKRASATLDIEYAVSLERLTNINTKTLNAWARGRQVGEHALDALYRTVAEE